MPKLNRAYKKGSPHRDSRLFVIIAEGEREDKYFAYFNERNSRIKVFITPRQHDASAPKHFVSRLLTAEESGDYVPEPNDEIWFVCDIDRWRNQINELKTECDQHENWNLAISNPCFEVWLHYHSGLIDTDIAPCYMLKATLPTTILGEFHPQKYCLEIERAVDYAQQADTEPNSDFPRPMQTKVYKLARHICRVLGHNWI